MSIFNQTKIKITIIGDELSVETAVLNLQKEKKEENEWFVISSEESKKFKGQWIVRLIKKENK